ncbi:MAG TPA: hypothetical protein VN864_01435 [Thermoplasmata archaeon]|nr:hypothetical protein [Thermoplasmata archaeon]
MPGRSPRRRFDAGDRIGTFLTPPRLSSLPRETEQLEFSSRSLVFPRDGDRILRVWGRAEDPWVLGVEPAGARWRVTAWGTDPATARRGVRDVFSLDHPLEEFYRYVRREPILHGTDRRFRGLRLPRDASVYEALIHAILGQQLSVAAANTIKGRLIEATDAVVEVEGQAVPRMPAPSEIQALGFEGLRRIGASGAKARALLSLAARRSAGAIEDDAFAQGTSEEAIERLDAEPGVGRWTAENALLRGIGRRDMFVAGDLGLRVALDRFGVVPRAAPEGDARAWADRHYPGWGSYATLYLWRRLVTEPATAG